MYCMKSVFPVTLVKICTVCHRFVTPTRPGLRCNGLCREYYHHGCVSSDYGRLGTMCAALNIDWSCIKCKASRRGILGAPLAGWYPGRKSHQKLSSSREGTSIKPDVHLADVVVNRYDSIDRLEKKKHEDGENAPKLKEQDAKNEKSGASTRKSSKDSGSSKLHVKKEKTEKCEAELQNVQKSSKEKHKRNSTDKSSDSSSSRHKKSEKRKRHSSAEQGNQKQESSEDKSATISSESDKISIASSDTDSQKNSSYFPQASQKPPEKIKSEKLQTVSEEAKKELTIKSQEENETSTSNKKVAEENIKSKTNKGKFLDAIMKEVQDYKQTQDDLLSSIMFITSAFYDLSTIMSVMKENTDDIKKLKEENSLLKNEIKDICTKLESMEKDVTSDLKAKKYLGEGDENIIMNITTKIRNKIDVQEE